MIRVFGATDTDFSTNGDDLDVIASRDGLVVDDGFQHGVEVSKQRILATVGNVFFTFLGHGELGAVHQ